MRRAVLIASLVLFTVAVAFGALKSDPAINLDAPAIRYNTAFFNDPVAQLNLKIERGEVHLKFNGPQGYLRSVLEALNVPIESQLVVFSKTSFQSDRITPANPRSIFFTDNVAVGWTHGGPFVEMAGEDPKEGMVFYSLPQNPKAKVRANRDPNCLPCHVSDRSMGVPGTLMRSVYPAADGTPVESLTNYLTDDRSPFAQRWGGWYVTGLTGSMPHMGNSIVGPSGQLVAMQPSGTRNLVSLKSEFGTENYLSPYSDVVALMVFEHQMHMMNLLTRTGWEVRLALYRDQMNQRAPERDKATQRTLRDTSRDLVDYMLFVDEPPLTSPVQGTSGFAEKFSSEGPRDSQGRSLRQFDLQHRLMRYPCSYMIYSDAFDGLPDEAKSAIYQRMWKILSGQEKDKKYAKLSLNDRRNIVEILRATKRRLPRYFQPVTR
jgi:hypothetical protein